MKLSEILGWKEEIGEGDAAEQPFLFGKTIGHNSALTSCDREIDREALAKVVFGLKSVFKNPYHYSLKEQEKIALDDVQTIISTMPTWLKRIEKV